MLMMLISGGQGTIVGPLLGSLIFTVLPEWLRFTELLRLSIFGLMLILIVIFLPRGIYPALRHGYAFLSSRINRRKELLSRESDLDESRVSSPSIDSDR